MELLALRGYVEVVEKWLATGSGIPPNSTPTRGAHAFVQLITSVNIDPTSVRLD